jgi:two-component system NarL family sensor kinase
MGERVRVTVTDDGIGLPEQVRTGVGLASMRERVAELGGSCTVRAGEGGGTLVSATLPAP